MYSNTSATFKLNDLMLCFMIFFRIYFFARSILSISFYTDPRSQRVCNIYGADAGYYFAMKALMKEKPWNVLGISLMMSVFVFGYCLRLFERVVQDDFDFISTSIWNVLITMTTVGYGDYFPHTHCGRFVGIICSFWGVFIVSMFVVALTNMLEFNAPENKAYMLLFRLRSKEQLRTHGADMLAAKYRLKLIRQQGKFNTNEKLKVERKYRSHKQEFKKITRQIMNISDHGTTMENLKNAMDLLVEEIEIIRMAQFFIYDGEMKKAKRMRKVNKSRRH